MRAGKLTGYAISPPALVIPKIQRLVYVAVENPTWSHESLIRQIEILKTLFIVNFGIL